MAGALAVERALDLLQGEGGPWQPGDVARHRAGLAAQCASPGDLDAATRRLLSDLLICNAEPASVALLEAVDAALGQDDAPAATAAAAAVIKAAALLPGALRLRAGLSGATEVVVWRGDITSLQVDAVTNAANEAGLGCFQPGHRCIDNVIHRAAGPRLREACRRAMAERAATSEAWARSRRRPLVAAVDAAAGDAATNAMRDDDAAAADAGPLEAPPDAASAAAAPPPAQLVAGSPPIVTAGFRLPARHVLHVTGPHLAFKGASPTSLERAQLASAYAHCLDACAARGLRSIAFCCVSTGLFNYPSEAACACALAAVRAWLEAPEHEGKLDLVVFDVFTDEDAYYYQALAPTAFA
jgi:O-acetyl-ADP-ribose deacetylase (regulator of RNase III)